MRHRNLALSMLVLSLIGSSCSGDQPSGDDQPFWSVLVSVVESVESYSSVPDMAAASDLVVVGSIEEVTAGREWGDPREAENRVASLLFQVKVGEVLRGAMSDAVSDTLTWEYTLPGYNISHLQTQLTDEGLIDRTGTVRPFPERRVLLFLRVRDDLGSELSTAPEAAFVGGASYRLVSLGGLVAEADVTATSPLMGMDADSPPGRLLAEQVAERTFDEVVDLARDR